MTDRPAPEVRPATVADRPAVLRLLAASLGWVPDDLFESSPSAQVEQDSAADLPSEAAAEAVNDSRAVPGADWAASDEEDGDDLGMYEEDPAAIFAEWEPPDLPVERRRPSVRTVVGAGLALVVLAIAVLAAPHAARHAPREREKSSSQQRSSTARSHRHSARRPHKRHRAHPRHWRDTLRGAGDQLLRTGFSIAVIPFEAFLNLDAILRSAWRLLFSRRRLLEWTPMEQSDRAAASGYGEFLALMWVSPACAVVSVLALWARAPGALVSAAPLLALWFAAPWLAAAISR